MKKIIFIFLTFFSFLPLVSANKTDYNLEITSDNKFKEKIVINIYDYEKITNGEDIMTPLIKDPILSTNLGDTYEKKVVKNGNDYTITLTYTYNEYKFKNANYLNKCFENSNVNLNLDTLDFDLSGNFYCQISEYTSINIVTDKNVSRANGKRTPDGYSWTIKNSANLKFTVLKENAVIDNTPQTPNNNIQNNNENKTNSIWVIILIVFVIVIASIILIPYLMKKSHQNNKI